MMQMRCVPFSYSGLISSMQDYQVIALSPWSPWGYERKHAALHGAGRYDDAINTFEVMLLRISQSPNPDIRGGYIDIMLSLSDYLVL